MNRRVFLKNSAGVSALLCMSPLLKSCREKSYYSAEDFEKTPKIDVHFHYNTPDDAFLRYANTIGMHLVSVCVDGGRSIDGQFDTVTSLKSKHPGIFDFLGTYESAGFDKDGFVEKAIASIDKFMNAGGKGIKIWKNIGMVLQDANGAYVMVDNPVFSPVFTYLEKQGIPMMAHLGEPRNCWLPCEKMTVMSDLRYYQRSPKYHMYQHPEMPSYEAQIIARDHLLDKYPKLQFIGAHIGSLEWSVDEVARRFDRYPQFTVDLSARIGSVQLQSYQDRTKVQAFMEKYQDRILYGSDISIDQKNTVDIDERCKEIHGVWLSHWKYLATDAMVPASEFNIENAPKEIQGLQLSRKIIDKIFYENSKRIFNLA